MCVGRSKVFRKMSSTRPTPLLAPLTRCAYFTIALLLLSLAAKRVASMSLERLSVNQNELNSPITATKNDVEMSAESMNSEDMLVDDMELEPVLSNGDVADAYLLVPSNAGLSERESVEKNMIENAYDGEAVELGPYPNEATDMLMVETKDTSPLHVTLLGEPAPQHETIVTEVDAQTPIEFKEENAEMVPVLAVAVEEPQGSQKEVFDSPFITGEQSSDSEVAVNGENGGHVADVIVDATLELKKDKAGVKTETPEAPESPINESPIDDNNVSEKDYTTLSAEEETAAKLEEEEAIDSLSAMEGSFVVEHESASNEQVKSEENDNIIEETTKSESNLKDELKPQLVENNVAEEMGSKPSQSSEQIDFVPLDNQVMKEEEEQENLEAQNETKLQEIGAQDDAQAQSTDEQNEENKVLTEPPEREDANEMQQNAQLGDNKEDTAEEAAAAEPPAESTKKSVVEEIAQMIAEGNGEEITGDALKSDETDKEEKDTPAKDGQTNNENKSENNSQTVEDLETPTENVQAENDQIAEESESMAEIQFTEQNQIENEETQGIDEVEDGEKQETLDEIKEIVENKQPNDSSQSYTKEEEATAADETLPIGEVSEIIIPQEAAAENITEQNTSDEETIVLPVNNEPQELANENNKEEEPTDEVKQPQEIQLPLKTAQVSDNAVHEEKAETIEMTEEPPAVTQNEIPSEKLEDSEISGSNTVTEEEKQETETSEQLLLPSDDTGEREEHKEQEISEQLVTEEPEREQSQQQEIIGEKEKEEEKEEEKEQSQVETQQAAAKPPIVAEFSNSGPMKPTNSLLTTIIQMPQQQQQNTQIKEKYTPIKIENADGLSSPATTTTPISQNNSNKPPISMATSPQAPLNAMNSVLNYVNSSFMQSNNNNNNNNNKQNDGNDVDDDDLNSQLRRYDGAQVWRIVVQNDHDRKMADELQTKYGGQLWKEVKQEVDYLLKPQVLAEAAQHVLAANLSRIVLIENLQKAIEAENPSEAEIASFQNRKGHRLTWKAYHRLADIHGFFDYMAKTYPDICSVETIGYSLQKRPLKILKISTGNATNSGIWIDGGMHAREWVSPATVTFIANQLVEGWDDLPEYMRNINWYIHAVANPDGYEYSHTTDRLWRKNMRSHGRQCPGVDLNRNFGYKWGGKGTSANPCSQTYRGSKAFSEPETFYISKFISNYPRDTFNAYLSFHSYGQYILYPWGYDYFLTDDNSDLDRVARQAGTTITKKSGGKFTVGSSAITLYPAAGGSDDWAKGFAGIKYAYTVEMGDTGRYGFVLPASYIEPNGRDGYNIVETVALAVMEEKLASRKRAY